MINFRYLLSFVFSFLSITQIYAQSWTNGAIVSWEGDSTFVEMFVDRKAKVDRYYSYLDVIVRSENDEIDTLTAKDIQAYQKDGITYTSNKAFDKTLKSDFFLKEIVSSNGTILYFSWGRINEEKKDFYYFKKENGEWYTLDGDSGTISSVGANYSGGAFGLQMKDDPDKALRIFFMDYFSDCDSLVRLLKEEFYGATEI